MADIIHFDGFCNLGRSVQMHEGQPETPEQVLEAMDHFGIHEALCIDALGRETNPMGGNERIIKRTADHPRLHPAWTGLMPQSRELPPPREFVAQMHEQGVGALYLFYRQFDIRLEDWGAKGVPYDPVGKRFGAEVGKTRPGVKAYRRDSYCAGERPSAYNPAMTRQAMASELGLTEFLEVAAPSATKVHIEPDMELIEL